MSKKPPKGNWEVRMRATITKLVYCEDCTEEEARNDPFEHATDEHEVDQIDYDVLGVEAAD